VTGPVVCYLAHVHWHAKTRVELLAELQSDAATGLSSDEASRRLERDGPNVMSARRGKSTLRRVLDQFAQPLVIVLIAAAGVSVALGDVVDALVIGAVVLVNAVIGFLQEHRAEQAIAALDAMVVTEADVLRDGRNRRIPSRGLVVGDVVALQAGDSVPADLRLLRSRELQTDEAALTGESVPVEKNGTAVAADALLGDRTGMAYSGTLVTAGRGFGLVVATGGDTEIGRISALLAQVETLTTPLLRQIARFGQTLTAIILALAGFTFAWGVWVQDQSLADMFLAAVALAVAAIPEGLPAIITITLAIGVQRMAARNAVIRRLPAVETLGSVTVICSDKTGTLTLNRMTVQALDMANHSYRFSYSDKTSRLELEPTADNDSTTNPTLDLLLIGGSLNSDATIDEADDTKVIGDPTEAALVSAAALVGMHKAELETAFPRVAEVPFDSVRKRMTTLHSVPESSNGLPDSLITIWERQTMLDHNNRPDYVAFTKGAIDGLLAISPSVWVDGKIQPLDEAWKKRIMASHDEMAAKGMRVLGVALRPWDSPPDETTEEALEQDLILLGMVGMIAPPRPEVKDAVANCKAAGIRPVMITGDHPLTARHIAQQIGISDNDNFITGQELDRLSPTELEQRVRDVSVFARVSPEHKLRLIDVYQNQHNIVSMTGDGVNDAPALKKADIGVAMGITGTDVAKSAAEMVLLDDNFATIVAAVEEGRIIYDNIRRFIKYLLTCNVSEIAVMIIGPFLGMPLPLLPLQILWMNLVTDGLPALALSIEPPEKDVMKRQPFSATESVFGRGMPAFIILFGVVLSIIALLSSYLLWRENDQGWQTVLFSTLVFAQLGMALSVRSERESLFRTGLLTNKPMILAIVVTVLLQLVLIYWGPAQSLFHLEPLSARDLIISFALGMLVIVLVEIWKVFARRRAED